MKAPRLILSSLFAPALLLVACEADAAMFTWGSATNISGATDVVTDGALVGAYNVGDGANLSNGFVGVASATVNGVTFSPFALNSGAGLVNSGSVGNFTLSTTDLFASDNTTLYSSGSAPFSALPASYQTLLGSATSVSALIGASTFDLTMSSLIVGHQYEFQWFASASGAPAQLHAGTAGNMVTLNDNVTSTEGGLGQYAVGTFTADAASQMVNFSAGDANNVALINGFQLRDLSAIPEPTGFVTGFLCVGVAALRRKRTATV